MNKSVPTILFAALLVFAGACSSDDDGDSAGGSGGDSASETSGSESTSELPPIMVDTAQDVDMGVGEFINIVTEGADRATSSDPSVLEATDAYSDGSAEFNAGAEALAVGTAVLGVYEGDSLLYEVNVTVTD